jgi:hypothetical protein
MCNAKGHDDGCTCGFGPPYPPTYRPVHTTDWEEEALDDPAVAKRGLRELAWDGDAINEFLQKYEALRNSDLPRNSIVGGIRQLLGLRRKVEERFSEEWVKVPLYRFGAPPVPGASVEYAEGGSLLGGAGYDVKVLGVGTGHATTIQLSGTRTFVAKEGSCKEVYVPVKLRVAEVAVYDGDHLVGRGVEAHVLALNESGDEKLARRGCSTLPKRLRGEGPTEGAERFECLLADDTSDAVHRDTRSWEADIAHEVRVSLARFVGVSALARIKRTRRLALTFFLPSGRDYRAYLAPGVLWWERPR